MADGQRRSTNRFWAPRESEIVLTLGGLLLDPEAMVHGVATNPDAHALQPIATPGCTVLLGEPGMGKSTCIAALAQAISAQAGVRTQRFSLGEFQSDERLERRIFGSPEARAWREGTETLHLLLDGLDEGCLWMPNLPRILEGMLREQPADRLRLYLACRSTIWPAPFESFLRERFPAETVEVLELLPLRERDVLDEATDSGVDPQSFLRAVRDRRVEAFAAKPITLRFLLSVFRRNGALPERETELYSAGCLHLCEEPDPARRATRRQGTLSAQQRVELAERIAAGMAFCSRPFVWTGETDPPPGAITLEDLASAKDAARRPSRENLLEALDTGLFSVRGPNQVAWSHQTYAEYLAAAYCSRQAAPLDRLLDIFSHAHREPPRVAPQLHETAAWLASMRHDFFARLLQVDPQVLLESDTSNTSPEDRSRLVSRLLSEFERGEIDENIVARWGAYARLSHPGLGNQLEPYMTDRTRPQNVREVAIDMARACFVSSAVPHLTTLALSSEEPISLRVASTRAIRAIGSEGQRRALLPLRESIEDDEDDQLKGSALLALWPACISPAHVFSSLTQPRNDSFVGAYSHFLWDLEHGMATFLRTDDDLRLALQWVASQPAGGLVLNDAIHGLGRVIVSILHVAWSRLGDPSVLDAFVAAANSQLLRHEIYGAGRQLAALRTLVESDESVRRRVVHRALELSGWTFENLWLLQEPLRWIQPERDVSWIAENIRRSPADEPQVRAWTAILEQFAWRIGSLTREFEELYGLYESVPFCRQRFAGIFGPVALRSEQATQLREQHRQLEDARRRLEASNAETEEDVPDLPQQARFIRFLDRFDGGEPDAFWVLQHDLSAEPDSTMCGDLTIPDFTSYPGWRNTDDATRARIVLAGRRYLVEAPGRAEEWLGTDQHFYSELAAFRTLYVLRHLDPNYLDSLGDDVWARWAPICLGYTAFSSALEDGTYSELVALAYRRAPEAFLRALSILIRREAARSDHVFVVRRLAGAWDERLARHVLALLDDRALGPGAVLSILEHVIGNVSGPAIEWCNRTLDAGPGTDPAMRRRSVATASALLTYAPQSMWSRIFGLMQTDVDFAREILLDHVDRAIDSPHDILAPLDEVQLGNLYVWLELQFSVDADPRHGFGLHRVEPRDQVARLRNHSLQTLARRGTRAAVSSLESVCTRLPQHEWLRRVLLQARSTMLERTWLPLTPVEFFGLLEDSQTRRVESEAQLLEVVIESLSRLQRELRGEMPASFDLWDRMAGGQSWRPKEENDLSNYVARHLRRDLADRGVVVGREVQIRRPAPPTRGEQTDIHVDAIVAAPREGQLRVVTVIIEIKGSWNEAVTTDMEEQLRDRYLAENACQHGLYLVGWYRCAQWDNSDRNRTRSAAQRDLGELRAALEAQAEQVSSGGIRIRAVVLDASLP
jgi:hypothetical protein